MQITSGDAVSRSLVACFRVYRTGLLCVWGLGIKLRGLVRPRDIDCCNPPGERATTLTSRSSIGIASNNAKLALFKSTAESLSIVLLKGTRY